MCDLDNFNELQKPEGVSRRQFGALGLGAGLAAMLPRLADAAETSEAEVMIKTPDGNCDAHFVHPRSGASAAVLVWPDVFGLRDGFRTMGRRLAESGYAVLTVNPFYRVKKAPTSTGTAFTPDLQGMMGALNETTHVTDAKAFVAWLDAQPQVDKRRKIGTTGYCMGGPDRDAHGGQHSGARRRRRHLPWRRTQHHRSQQPAPADSEDEGAAC